MRNRDLLVLVVCVLLFSNIWIGAVNRQAKIEATGDIVTLGVGCDTPSIYWGMIEPNETVKYTIQVWVTGNVDAVLAFNTTNWNPSNASDFIVLTWDYTGVVLEPSVRVTITLWLHVASDIVDIPTFSFDMSIWAVTE